MCKILLSVPLESQNSNLTMYYRGGNSKEKKTPKMRKSPEVLKVASILLLTLKTPQAQENFNVDFLNSPKCSPSVAVDRSTSDPEAILVHLIGESHLKTLDNRLSPKTGHIFKVYDAILKALRDDPSLINGALN